MVLAFGVTFELPVFTFFLVRIGVWDYRFMLRSFRYAIVIDFCHRRNVDADAGCD